jgi:hypothetical protein
MSTFTDPDHLDPAAFIHTIDIHNLVAVLQSGGDHPPAYVYVDEMPERIPQGQCLLLDDLVGLDLTPYNGPVICFPELDVLRPDLLTKGPRFRSIRPLLQRRMEQVELNQIAYALAVALLGFVDDTAPDPKDRLRMRALPKIIALALPNLLAKRPMRGLIALRLDADLWRYLQDFSAQWIYLTDSIVTQQDMMSLAEFASAASITSDDWLIAFEEIQLFRPDLDIRAPTFLELRPILRTAGCTDALRATLIDLARLCQVRSQHDPRFRLPAWSAAAEYWLAQEEIDDLVCFVPDPDYENFTRTGVGSRYYRTLSGVDASDVGPYRLAALDRLFDRDRQIQPADSMALALPLLQACLGHHFPSDFIDLGYLFWRAGRTQELAQTLALLARDISSLPLFQRRERHLVLEAAYEAAWRACILLGLENPESEFRGFYEQIVRATYQTLATILTTLADQGDRAFQNYYLGLAAWLGCYSFEPGVSPKVETQLRQVVRHMSIVCHTLNRESELFARARQLRDIANASVSLMSGSGQPGVIQDYLDQISAPTGGRSDYRRAAADARSQPPLLSEFFVRGFQELAVFAEQIRLLYQSTLHEDDKVRHLRQMIARLEDTQRQLFALPHELAVLRTLYEQTIWQTANLARDLKGSALLELQLSTTTVQQHEPSNVTLILRNLGRTSAESVTVTLENSERFNILSMTANVDIEQLPPAATRRITFDLQPRVDDQLPLRFTVKYHDQQGYHVKPQDFVVHVVSLDRGPFTRKRNPYNFGNPIQDPHQFYGRRAEVLSVVDHFVASGTQNILVRGARRTGKTSVLYMLRAIVENAAGARAQFGIHADWDAALDSLRIVFLDLSGISGIGRNISAAEFYRAICVATSQAVGLVPELSTPFMNRAFFQQEMERYLAALPPNGRLVLLLDEFDVVETITEPEFYFHLRHVITYLQRIIWVVASAAGLYQAVQDYASPLFNVFRIIEIGRLNPDDARRLILDPIASEQMQFLDEAVEAVLEQTGRHPYFMQLLCSEIIEHLNTKQTNYVLRSTVQSVVENVVGRGRAAYDHFAYLWDHTDPVSRLILSCLLASPEPLNHDTLWRQFHAHVTTAYAACDETALRVQFERRLLWLRNVVEAIAAEPGHGYLFGTPLFRYWLNERGQHENLFDKALAQVIEKLQDPQRAVF